MEHVLISLYGNPSSPANQEAITNAKALVRLREKRHGGRFPLSVTFYDAESVRLWG